MYSCATLNSTKEMATCANLEGVPVEREQPDAIAKAVLGMASTLTCSLSPSATCSAIQLLERTTLAGDGGDIVETEVRRSDN